MDVNVMVSYDQQFEKTKGDLHRVLQKVNDGINLTSFLRKIHNFIIFT